MISASHLLKCASLPLSDILQALHDPLILPLRKRIMTHQTLFCPSCSHLLGKARICLHTQSASTDANDRLFYACRSSSLDYITHDLLNAPQTVHKLPEAVMLNVLPDIPQRDFIAHQVSYNRSAELCCNFLILSLS